MIDRSGRIAFCPARFGPQLTGGAEIVLRKMAERLQDRGWDVEILTTCATDHHTWDNVLPPGTSLEGGLRVRRFPVVGDPIPERADLERRILGPEPLSLAEQQRWMNSGMRVPELFHHLLDTAEDYRALVFTPYLFWVAFACSQVAPERSLLWTCLHDEPYAHLELFQPVFSGVSGLFFQSDRSTSWPTGWCPTWRRTPRWAAGSRFPSATTRTRSGRGTGSAAGSCSTPAAARGRRAGTSCSPGSLPRCAAHDLPLSLVTMGGGEVRAPAEIADRVIDLGFLPDAERDDAFAAADAYVQPSRYEAFSRTIMEAWLAGTPVIANAGSDVVAWHCRRSGAGLLYADQHEFEQCLLFLADAPRVAARLAAGGRDYVLAHYQWDGVLDQVEAALDEWTTGKN